MSNLVEHARRELEIIGEEEETIEGLVAVVQAFADMGHSGTSAAIAISQLEKLLRFENLSSLTNDKDEWTDVSAISGEPTWQSKRNPSALSFDGGKSYYFVSNSTLIYQSKVADKEPTQTP